MQVSKGTWCLRKQCVPGSLSSSPTQEPGNECLLRPMWWCHHSLVPTPLWMGGGGKRAWYTLFAHVPSSFGNLHTICHNAGLYSLWVKSETVFALMVVVCIASFKAIGEFQWERLHQSCATMFSWNGQTHGQFLQAKSWMLLLFLHRVWSVAGILQKFPNSQKTWGNRACTNSVYQALFSLPTHESLGTRLGQDCYSILEFESDMLHVFIM